MQEKEILQNTEEDTAETQDFGINADENAAGTTHLNNPFGEDTEVENMRAELEEQKEKYLRLFAEYDNFRRRTAREKIEFMQTAGKEVIISLLDVLDDCDRAEKQMQSSDDIEEIKKGVQLVFNKFRTALQSKGLKPMESINASFDVEKHEAITEIPAASKEQKGKVVDEVQKGYYLNGKIIRFAKVIVGK